MPTPRSDILHMPVVAAATRYRFVDHSNSGWLEADRLAAEQGCSNCCSLGSCWHNMAARYWCRSAVSGLAQCVLLPTQFRAMADGPSFSCVALICICGEISARFDV